MSLGINMKDGFDDELTAVLKFIREYFDCPGVGPEDNLMHKVLLDSIRYAEMVLFLEQKFKIIIPPPSLTTQALGTPTSIAQTVCQLKSRA